MALTILTGCDQTTSDSIAPKLAVQLPPVPSFMQPIAVPVLAVGEDARAALADSRGALRDANARLTQARGWYLAVRKRYAAAPIK